MPSNRLGRINEEIQRELAALIPTVKDPRVTGLISITRVETTPDLHFAKIYVSMLDKSDANNVVKGLKSAGGYLRRELSRALTRRPPPVLLSERPAPAPPAPPFRGLRRPPNVVSPAPPANAHIVLDEED